MNSPEGPPKASTEIIGFYQEIVKKDHPYAREIMSLNDTITGIVHGKTIKLDEEPGLPDGQVVLVTLSRATASPSDDQGREILRRAVGSWSDDVEGLERYLEWNRQQRKNDRRDLIE